MRRTCGILCVLVLMATLFGTMAPSASAADWEYTFSGNLGHTEYFVITSDPSDQILDAYIYSGEIPGMSLNIAGGVTLGLAGEPAETGEFTVFIYLKTEMLGDVDIQVTVYIQSELSSGTPVVTKNPTNESVVEGESAVFIARADNTRQYRWQIAIADASLDVAELPGYIGKGIEVSGENTEKLTLSNIPLELNGACLWCEFVGAEETITSDVAVITVIAQKDAVPEVTKHPTGETVEEGGEATFVAKAKYAQSYQWELISPLGTTCDCTDASKIFPGLTVTGPDTQKIKLTNIPLELDGCRIRCKFSAGEDVYSDWATIHVTEIPTEPTTEPPVDVTTPATNTTSTEPVADPIPETSHPIEVSVINDKTGSEEKNGSNTTLLIVLIISLAAVAIAGIASFTILKLKNFSQK